MALTATVHHFEVALSDVDRSVYETLDFRVAQHPSETTRWMLTRTLAYCLEWTDDLAFSKGGLSDTDDPPISIRDATDARRILRWIDVGAPSAERLHRAAKLASVAIYTSELPQLLRQTAGATIHKRDAIEVWSIAASFLDELAAVIDRRVRLELTRTEGALYVTTAGKTFETALSRASLAEPDS